MAEHSEKKKDDVIEIPVGKFFVNMRKNPWIISTVVLAIVLIVVVFMKSGGSSVTGTVSQQAAEQNLLSFINGLGKGSAQIVSAQQSGALYQITVNYQNQTIPVYVTLDGQYLISQPVPLTGSAANAGTNSNTNANTGATANSGQRVNITIDPATPVTGNANAPVTVVEFADFSCPYCEAASGDNTQMVSYMQQSNPNWQPIVTNLIKDYVNTGKVRFAVKYAYGHTGGHAAQSVAWCLNDQSSSLYWKFYPQAFAHASTDVENLTLMESVAQSLGANMAQLQSCISSGKYNDRFNTEQNEATAAGVQGTPAFFVNGKLIEGAVPYSQFKQAVDAELNNQSQ